MSVGSAVMRAPEPVLLSLPLRMSSRLPAVRTVLFVNWASGPARVTLPPAEILKKDVNF